MLIQIQVKRPPPLLNVKHCITKHLHYLHKCLQVDLNMYPVFSHRQKEQNARFQKNSHLIEITVNGTILSMQFCPT